LDKGDDEGALGEEHAGHPFDERDRLIREGDPQVGLGGKGTGVELLQSLGDAFRLDAGKTSSYLMMPFVSITSVCICEQCSSRRGPARGRAGSIAFGALIIGVGALSFGLFGPVRHETIALWRSGIHSTW
jgi:hypothetical protein